jgi:hypothetical protein
MTDYYRLTSDRIKIADEDVAEQITEQYLTHFQLSLELQNEYLSVNGEWIFAVEHEDTSDEDEVYGEPLNNLDFLADVARVADADAFPFTITEVCQGSLDHHPGMTRYDVTADEIRMTYGDGNIKTWAVADHGIVTTPGSR